MLPVAPGPPFGVARSTAPVVPGGVAGKASGFSALAPRGDRLPASSPIIPPIPAPPPLPPAETRGLGAVIRAELAGGSGASDSRIGLGLGAGEGVGASVTKAGAARPLAAPPPAP